MTKRFILVVLLACLFAAALAQPTPVLTQDDLNDPAFVTLLNNYFGCKTWDEGVCVECSENYYFNNKGICCEVKPECKNFNREVGICEGCYQGWEVVDGKCVITDLANSKDKGCKTFTNGVCTQCSARWYFGAGQVCQPVDDLCHTWADNGNCLTCYNGYIV